MVAGIVLSRALFWHLASGPQVSRASLMFCGVEKREIDMFSASDLPNSVMSKKGIRNRFQNASVLDED
jgi:hypothetical protein